MSAARAIAPAGPDRPARRRLSPEAREADLLAAAREVLRDVGYEKFQPAEVARRAGVSEGLIYRYFPTRRDLLARVAEEWLEEILADEPDLSKCADTYERLREVIAYALQVIRAEPALTRYILLELRADPDFRGSAVHQLNRRFTGLVIHVLRDAVAAGEFRRDVSLTLLRDTIFGAVEHRTWAYLRGEGDFPVQETAEGLAAVICGGMLLPPSARSRPAGAKPAKRAPRRGSSRSS